MDQPLSQAAGADRDGRPAALELSDVRLRLTSRAGTVEVLRGIDLSVAAGTSLAVVGPSGSGKTSMLMVAAGLEPVTSGTVRVAGHDITNLDEDQLARFRRHHVGIVFQSFHLIATMTAQENVAAPMEFARRPDARAAARNALADVGLADRLAHYPGELSGGEQQRVAIARALAAGAGLILADEPTGNLDQETGKTIIDLLFAARSRHGATLVLVTHDAAIAEACDRRVFLRDGRLA